MNGATDWHRMAILIAKCIKFARMLLECDLHNVNGGSQCQCRGGRFVKLCYP